LPGARRDLGQDGDDRGEGRERQRDDGTERERA
jgi:hypothetical protein